MGLEVVVGLPYNPSAASLVAFSGHKFASPECFVAHFDAYIRRFPPRSAFRYKRMSLIIGRGGETDPAALRLFTTANRRYIENERPEEERPIEALKAAFQHARSVSPTAKCRSLTSMYNCVGMVFASRRTAVDCKYLDLILRDDGYSPIPRERIIEGDIVVYRRNAIAQHVGIIYELRDVSLEQNRTRFQTWVLSQWGEDGEYLHELEKVPPIYGSEIEFWSERRVPA